MKASAAALVLGGRIALSRLYGRSAFCIAGGAVAFCALAAWAERYADRVSAVSQALCGPAFGLAIPIASVAFVTVSLVRTRPEDAMQSAGMLGANRRTVVLGALLVTSAVSALTCTLAAAVAALVAYARLDTAAISDAMTSAWVGALTGCAYVFFFGAASTIGRRGGGRLWAFFADWLLGPLVGAGAAAFPRSHALNLLGAAPVLQLPQKASFGVLVAMVGVFGAIAAVRTRP